MNLGNTVVVVGAGPVGIVGALLLARQGNEVHVFDRREDPRKVAPPRGRSISLTLTQRGWTALRRAGVESCIRQIAIPLQGRQIHLESGELRYQPYGVNGEHIDCVPRPDLTATLINEAEKVANVHLHFGWKCIAAAPEEGSLTFHDPSGAAVRVQSDRILAADGATSAVRDALASRGDVELQRTRSTHYYKELTVDELPADFGPLKQNALHVWPRGDCMLVAFPTPSGGFSFTLFLPMTGERSFDALSEASAVQTFIENHFSDLRPLLPYFLRDFYEVQPSSLVSVRCYPWVFHGLALIGDAAHSMFPFLGQGLNAGLEDLSVLLDCIQHGDGSWQDALGVYQKARKANCDAVTEIAAQHYGELAEATKDPRFLLRKRLEVRLGELFPKELASPYHIVSFSDRPYLEARRTAALQRRIIEQLIGIADVQTLESGRLDSDLVSVAEAVLSPTSVGT
ncbi:MAG TPA: NAD(P)/FAD-dependent oxidoreductase [Polyangiaceae bacterium]|nr:NAD(P)/FAD-dependent oxidoreductase [Polyangiaceae bacterium]